MESMGGAVQLAQADAQAPGGVADMSEGPED